MHEVAIIGSGVSGGRIADELTRRGVDCVLLEAGSEIDRAALPMSEFDYSTRLFWGGGIEVSRDGRLGLLRGRCVGGTSMLNQALLDRFDDEAWRDWRDRSGLDWLDAETFDRHYAACLEGMEASYVEARHRNRNCDIFTEAFDRKGLGWAPLLRGQSDCRIDDGTDCIACLGGCARESKQSAVVTTIRRARERGLELVSDCEVQRVEHHADRVVVHADRAGSPHELTARRVVLAAGAIGNSAILLRSGLGASLPAIGRGFACHPQYMVFGLFDEEVDAHKGAFQSVKSDDASLRAAGLKIENVFAPPIGTAMLLPGQGRRHRELMHRYRNMASMEVALRDEADGRIRLDKRGRVVIDKRLGAADRAKAQRGLALLHDLFASVGARETIECTSPFGLHLMGGCAIGSDERTSVVGPDFAVHGHPNLYAADSSIFPGAPGINPSYTIMALSHRASEVIAT